MRKTFKLYRGFLGAHFSAILILLLISIPFSSFEGVNALLTVINLFIYAACIYSAGWNAGFRDSRKVGESVPNVKMACVVAGLTCVIPVVLLVLRVTAYHVNPTSWRPYGKGYEMILTPSTFLLATDIIYRLYNFYLISFLSDGSLGMYILPILFPVIIYPISYIVGLTRFSVIEKYLPFLIYKPKNKKKLPRD